MRLESRRTRDTLVCLCLVLFAILLCVSLLGSNGIDTNHRCQQQEEQHSARRLSTRKSEPAKCVTVHIALICGGYDATRDFYTLLKSILFYRVKTKLQVHLFVNNVSRRILTELFRTWVIPDFSVAYYEMSDYEPDIAWIPNQHYSHRYGLLKLVAPTVLANVGLERAIFLDTDLLIHGDITELWAEFAMFEESPEAFMGLVENQSDWYLAGTGNQPQYVVRGVSWPALGRGFNTGVMLIDLSRLKKANWDAMWRDVAETELVSHLTTVLADQDIYNAVIKRNSWIVLKLDCRFNLQLNDHTLLNETCPTHQNKQGVSLTHWNSPYKLNTRNDQAEYYNSWHTTFLNWNARLLERPSCASTHTENEAHNTSDPKIEELCHDIRPRPHERLRTFLYFLPFEMGSSDEYDVTIVVHLSMDRFGTLDELASHWRGPMSVALYLSELGIGQFLESLRAAESLSKRKNIGYHLVFMDTGSNYPINRLRNTALNNVMTPFVFMTDVDFLPSPGLYDYLRFAIKKMSDEAGYESLQTQALVIPTFENNEYKFDYPASKSDLIRQLDLGTLSKFRESIWPQGQAATDYNRWKLATKPYKISWQLDYEPFIVASANVTRYDERFNGFGWNKVEHVMMLAAEGYEFQVLPEAYSIHQFHSASYDIRRHRQSKRYQACIRLLKQTFLADLQKRHPEFADKFARRVTESG